METVRRKPADDERGKARANVIVSVLPGFVRRLFVDENESIVKIDSVIQKRTSTQGVPNLVGLIHSHEKKENMFYKIRH